VSHANAVLLHETIVENDWNSLKIACFSDSVLTSRSVLFRSWAVCAGTSHHRRSQGFPPPKFLEHVVILCFERRFPKQNIVICQKPNTLGPQMFGLATLVLHAETQLLQNQFGDWLAWATCEVYACKQNAKVSTNARISEVMLVNLSYLMRQVVIKKTACQFLPLEMVSYSTKNYSASVKSTRKLIPKLFIIFFTLIEWKK